jgi:recombinational DNA repair ATPase RecF
MFVSQINIREFRGIKECKEPIELSKFTVLLGRNNSGKSTLLEALSLLPHPLAEDPLHRTGRISVLNKLHSGKPLVYKYAGVAEIGYFVEGKKLIFKIPEKGDRSLR